MEPNINANIKKKDKQELIDILLTSDGEEVKVKKEALAELMERLIEPTFTAYGKPEDWDIL